MTLSRTTITKNTIGSFNFFDEVMAMTKNNELEQNNYISNSSSNSSSNSNSSSIDFFQDIFFQDIFFQENLFKENFFQEVENKKRAKRSRSF